MTEETLPDIAGADRVLAQHEIDEALGFAVPDRAAEGDARTMVEAGAIPPEPMPMLPIIFDDLCGRLSASLRELFGREVSVGLETLRPRRYQDIVDDLVLPAQLTSFAAEGWDGGGLLAAGPDLAMLVLDTLLGAGPGGAGRRTVARPFSPIESAILVRVADLVLHEATAAFTEVAPVVFRREGVESDPRLVAIARPGDIVLSATLRVALDTASGLVVLALPLATLGPARPALRSAYMGARPERGDGWANHLATEMWQAQIEAEAVLHETRLPLRQVLGLAVGDTLMFDMRPSDLVELRCGGLTVSRGNIGRIEGRIAVQIAEPVLRPRPVHPEGILL